MCANIVVTTSRTISFLIFGVSPFLLEMSSLAVMQVNIEGLQLSGISNLLGVVDAGEKTDSLFSLKVSGLTIAAGTRGGRLGVRDISDLVAAA